MIKIEDDIAREVYIGLRNKTNAIDMIKKRGIHPREIKSDMILFKEVISGVVTNTYYDRIEVKNGKKTNVIKIHR